MYNAIYSSPILDGYYVGRSRGLRFGACAHESSAFYFRPRPFDQDVAGTAGWEPVLASGLLPSLGFGVLGFRGLGLGFTQVQASMRLD